LAGAKTSAAHRMADLEIGSLAHPAVEQGRDDDVWAAAGFKDTLLRLEMKPEVVHGEKKDI